MPPVLIMQLGWELLVASWRCCKQVIHTLSEPDLGRMFASTSQAISSGVTIVGQFTVVNTQASKDVNSTLSLGPSVLDLETVSDFALKLYATC